MKIALLTDTHFGARGDSLVFFDYMMEFYDNVFFPYLAENNIKTMIHLGDVVDRRKFINFNILHGMKTKFIQRLQDEQIESHVIIGNHDTYFKNTNDINSMNELIDFNHKYSPKVYSDPTTISFDGRDLCIMPWINSGNFVECRDHIKNTSASVLFGHLEISGFEMNKGIRCEDGLDIEMFRKFDLVCSGHFHHKSNNGNIHYLGNPYELTWIDYNDTRGFHVYDTETNELEFIVNPYRMFHKIYYDESKLNEIDYSVYHKKYVKVIVKNKTKQHLLDNLIDELYNSDVVDVSVVDDTYEFEGMDETQSVEDTITLLSSYIDGYNLDLDKNRLKGLIQDLYITALREPA
jgi:DNA repair exonuclease SbcCD nuclease subunit